MSELINYNIVKEGCLYNADPGDNTRTRRVFSASEFVDMYGLSASASISGTLVSGTVSSIEVVWGETYDVGSVHYYHDAPTSSGISISHGLTSGSEFPVAFTTTSGGSHTGYIGDARFIRIVHSVSHGHVFTVSGVYVAGIRNEQLSFVSTSPGQTSRLVSASPYGYLGLVPTEVSIENTYDAPVDVKISLAPTGTAADDYVFLSTTSSGVYYGLNDYGVFVPATQKIRTVSDQLLFDNPGDMAAQWYVLEGGMQGRVVPSSDGLSIRTSTAYALTYTGGVASTLFGLLSRHSFTGDQSFTIKLKVKLSRVTHYFVEPLEVVFGFSNNMPLPSVSYNAAWPGIDERSLGRAGRSGACLCLRSSGQYFPEPHYLFLYGDGDLSQSVGSFSQVYLVEFPWSTAGDYDASTLGSILGGSADRNKDWSAAAGFRQLIITWDHVDRLATGYIDGLKVGEHRFTNIPQNGVRFFMALATNMNTSADVFFRDFEVYTDRLYKQRRLAANGLLTASANRTADPEFHGPDKLVDYTGVEWVGGYNPQSNDWVEVILDTPRDVIGAWIKNPYNSGFDTPVVTSVSGSLTMYLQYMLKTVYFQPSLGPGFFRSVPTTSEVDSLYRFIDASGLPTTLSGLSSVRATFVDMYGPSGHLLGKPALALREFDLIEEYYAEVPAAKPSPVSGTVPWDMGSFNNLRQPGYSGELQLASTSVREIALVYDASLLVRGVDYDVSSSLAGGGYGHGGEQDIFRSCGCLDEWSVSVRGNWVYTVPAYVWRSFGSCRRVKAVYAFWGSGLNVPSVLGLINRFKVQYLRPGSSPSEEGSWENVPVILIPYSGSSSAYAAYRQHFIDNNDGEFYTNVAYSYRGCPGQADYSWVFPEEVAARQDWRWSSNFYLSGSCLVHLTSSFYLEFDAVIETEAVRLVITECLNEPRTAPVDTMNLFRFAVFSDVANGEYTSPVFDTGDNLNTERLFAVVQQPTGADVTAYVRSSRVPPVCQHDDRHLFWQPWVIPLKDTRFDVSTGDAGISGWTHYLAWPKHGLVVGSKVYIMPTEAGYNPIYYDYSDNSWGVLPQMGPVSENIRASTTIYNHAVLTDSGIMYVAVEVGEQNTSRFMRYDFEADQYGISGWRHLGVNRPPEVVTGGMVSHGDSLYLFGQGGQTVLFNPDTSRWDPTLAPMPLHDRQNRYDFWPLRYGNSVFIFGGSCSYPPGGSVGFIDRYDIASNSWETVDYFRFFVGGKVYALRVGNQALILSAAAGVHAVFDLDAERLVHDAVLPLSISNFLTPGAAGFSAETAWAYGNEIVAFDYPHIMGTGGFGRKTKLVGTPWEPGTLPSLYDTEWGVGWSSQIPWQPLTTDSELVPQDRYVQFKIHLTATSSGVSSPSIERAGIVIPQTLGSVPSGNNASVFVRTGVATASLYEVYYSGAESFVFNGFGWSLYRALSQDGLVVGDSRPVLSTTDSGGYHRSFIHSCVHKSAPNSYKLWGTCGWFLDVFTDVYQTCVSGSIFNIVSSDGLGWSEPVEVIPVGYEGLYDTAGSYFCSVVGDTVTGFHMWYTGIQLGTSTSRILHTTSSDGLSWVPPSLAVDINNPGLFGVDSFGVSSPSVVYDSSSGVFILWYSASSATRAAGFVRATSVDGVTWTGFIVVSVVHEEYTTRGVLFPYVIKDVNTFKMWFVGVDSVFERRVLYSESPDGVVWSTPVLVISRGLNGNDGAGQGPVAVISNRALEVPDRYISGAQLKVYNG